MPLANRILYSGATLVLVACFLAAVRGLAAALGALLLAVVVIAAGSFALGIAEERRQHESASSKANKRWKQEVHLRPMRERDRAGAEVLPLDSVQVDDPPAARDVRLPETDPAEQLEDGGRGRGGDGRWPGEVHDRGGDQGGTGVGGVDG